MATRTFGVDIIGQQLPADFRQRKLATLFSSTPGENIQPYPYWYHNVVPTARGFKSISYERLDAIPAIQAGIVQHIPPSYIPVESVSIYTIPLYVVNNKLYTFDFALDKWDLVHDLGTSTITPTTAYVNGTSYAFHPVMGLKKYDFLNRTWVDVTLKWAEDPDTVVPPTTSEFVGIVDNTGYLVMYTTDTIYYSSPTNPEDFSLTKGGVSTGAGSTRVQPAIGEFQMIAPIAGGAIIYTNKNMVSMRYTNNARNPWSFVELADGAGIVNMHHIANDTARAYHYVWTTHGIMQISLSTARRILPEWTQQISSELYALDVNGEVQTKQGRVNVRMNIAAGSVLLISVGSELEPYAATWVYDLDLNRWGRLQYPHLDIAQYIEIPDIYTYEKLIAEQLKFKDLSSRSMRALMGTTENVSAVSRELVFIGTDGYRYKVDLAAMSSGAEAFVLVGDIRMTRSKACILQQVRLQTTEGLPSISVYTKDQAWRDFMHNPYEPDCWVEYSSGAAHTIKLEGDFIISSMEVTLQQAGYSL